MFFPNEGIIFLNQRRNIFKAIKKYISCHTATVGGHVTEGYVSASDIQRPLKEKPVALGLTAHGMPIGSPGMDSEAYKGLKEPYNVFLIQRDGSNLVFQSNYGFTEK